LRTVVSFIQPTSLSPFAESGSVKWRRKKSRASSKWGWSRHEGRA
jgi:hypothetical protein